MAAGDVATVFLDMSLGTRLAVSFPAASTTVADLKRRVSHEHGTCFPNFGQVAVQSVKVDQGGSWFHLADSMAVRDAFQFLGANKTWHLQVDALPHPQHLHQGMVTEGHSKDSSAIRSEPSCEMLTDQVEVEVGEEEPLTAKGERSSNMTDPKGSKEAEATSTEQRACERKRLRPRNRVGKTPTTKGGEQQWQLGVGGDGHQHRRRAAVAVRRHAQAMPLRHEEWAVPGESVPTLLGHTRTFVLVTNSMSPSPTRRRSRQNVPREFSVAQGYAESKKVLLRMGGESWTVNLKHFHTVRGKARTSFRYGWHQFCVDNRLRVGETCFFRALGQGGGDRHVLKVEVRRLDGSYAS